MAAIDLNKRFSIVRHNPIAPKSERNAAAQLCLFHPETRQADSRGGLICNCHNEHAGNLSLP
jgi:hypothetical protein